MTMFTCTRNGCGARFVNPTDGVCRYHPGAPVFHEGLKGWSCCKTNFTDFGEFLAHPGCTAAECHDASPKKKEVKNVGRPDKPADGAAEENDAPVKAEPPVDDGLGSHHIDRAVPMERPTNSAKIALKVTETESAKKAFAKAMKNHEERMKAQAEETKVAGGQVPTDKIVEGAPCLHNSCMLRYVDEGSLDDGKCTYHRGIPVFHEGLKYWSCCDRKKFTEFDDCMSHRGCTTGKCKFIPTAEDLAKANNIKCRYDFIQSGSNVTITIYAKAIDVATMVVKSSVTELEVSLLYKFTSAFSLNLALSGCVDPESSEVTVYGTKVEIALKKADGCAWEELGKELESIKL